jgi:choice-of-anchor C domain-containing protein
VRKIGFGGTLAIVATLAVAGAALAATPFTNGGFEAGSAGNFAAGSSAVTGWVITGTDVDVADATVWPAQAGSQSLDLNGFGPGAIAQTIPTVINATYVVQFYMSGNPGTHEQFPNGDASPVVKTMTVTANGAQSDAFSFDTTPYATSTFPFPAMGWTAEAYSFKATSTTTTVKFASTTAGAFGPALDSISFTETLATGANCKDDGWKTMVNPSTGIAFRNQGACVSYFATSGATPIGPGH